VWDFFFLVVQTMHKDGVYDLHIGKCSKPHWAEHDCIRCTESSAVSFAMRSCQGSDCFHWERFRSLAESVLLSYG
jgi:hypothetical protein